MKAKVFFLSALITMGALSANAFAASSTMDIEFRIEGINKNLYYGTISVPYEDSLTLQDAFIYLDENEDSITITGADTAYISDVNGDVAATFGGWDGWLCMVNGKDIETGIDGVTLSDSDSVTLYYSDLYGVGMQFPKVDTSQIESGILTFTSTDTTYDENFNATQTENPVADMTVFWDGNEYTTDEKGVVTISAEDLTNGSHLLSVEKYTDAGIPLVLRLEPDFCVEVSAQTTTTTTTTTTAATTTTVQTTTTAAQTTATTTASENLPNTGTNENALTAICAVLALGSAGAAVIKRNEK